MRAYLTSFGIRVGLFSNIRAAIPLTMAAEVEVQDPL
jgi:hypothetical protein